ncbi:hypothetical protein [Streptomyces sp. TR06-5]|uniref:hypothetical protein n=1 Tax=unclassified Streptomyces TaxID=2593676 RepID=UPI0039A2A58D
MEQRPETPSPVVLGAGTDPTHIPGLDPVESDEPEKTAAAPADPVADAVDEEERSEDGTESGESDDAPPEGPSFEVSDHRGSIAADGEGIVFRLDETEARFAWSEIGSVEIGSSRFGRRFEVAVGTTDHRRFDAEVQAASRTRLEEWTTQLDEVLDAWFEDSAGTD